MCMYIIHIITCWLYVIYIIYNNTYISYKHIIDNDLLAGFILAAAHDFLLAPEPLLLRCLPRSFRLLMVSVSTSGCETRRQVMPTCV